MSFCIPDGIEEYKELTQWLKQQNVEAETERRSIPLHDSHSAWKDSLVPLQDTQPGVYPPTKGTASRYRNSPAILQLSGVTAASREPREAWEEGREQEQEKAVLRLGGGSAMVKTEENSREMGGEDRDMFIMGVI